MTPPGDHWKGLDPTPEAKREARKAILLLIGDGIRHGWPYFPPETTREAQSAIMTEIGEIMSTLRTESVSP